MATGYYVSVQDGQRRGLLLGPFDTHEEALGQVDNGRKLAEQVNDRARWFAYGTARVEGAMLPDGRLSQLALTALMVSKLAAADIRTREAAAALSIDERDQVLGVAAWSSAEDQAWGRALEAVPS